MNSLNALHKIDLAQGDITQEVTDAIVNAANTSLLGGGGVDGAIHRAGGPSILEECRLIGGCRTGEAVITTGGNLKARYVIHTVGPVYQGGDKGEPELLSSAYRNSMRVAKIHRLRSVAFPSISTGVFSYPIPEAARIALRTILQELAEPGSVELVRFVLFDAGAFSEYRNAFDEIAGETRAIPGGDSV